MCGADRSTGFANHQLFIKQGKTMNINFKKALVTSALASTAVSSAHGITLEEIVVTAQKRSESMQDVPIAITAQTGETLEKLNITSSDDLSAAIPGLQIGRQTNASAAFIRGVGNNNGSAGNEPSVPIYVDGVYNPFINGNIMTFNNIDRIEVLKGPQGTVFGRNATGGIIHVITKDPEYDTSGKLKVGLGNYDTVESTAYATTGITDNLAADIAVVYIKRNDGWVKNRAMAEEFGLADNVQVRSKWLYEPTDATTLRFTAYWGDDEGNSDMARSFVGDAESPFVPGVKNPGGYHETLQNHPGFYDHESKGVSLQIDHELTDAIDLVSITSYADVEAYFQIDQDATPAPIVDANLSLEDSAVTQEIRLQSSWDKHWNWMAGLYYFDFDAEYLPLQLAGVIGGAAAPIDIYSEVQTESAAVFGEFSYEITDTTKLTVGVRYTEDELDLSGQTQFANGAVSAPAYEDSSDFEETTYRVVLDHNLTEDVLLYGSYSTGYKAGVYNLVVTSGVPADALPPETVDAFELGFKSDLADGTLRLNGATFYYEYENLQFATLVPGAIVTNAAAKAEIYGAELEATWLVTDNLDFQAGISWVDGEFTGAQDANKDNSIIRTPETTANLIANYSIPMESGMVELSGIVSYFGEMYWDPDNVLKEPSYTLVNASAAWVSAAEDFRISIWGKNLTDEEYSTYTTNSAFGQLYTPGQKTTYGISAEYAF
jgi:iron complex outermembrane recepter protein